MLSWLAKRWNYSMPSGGTKEKKEMFLDSLKMALIHICLMDIGIASTIACGRLGKEELDGVSLAVSTINIIGLSMLWGLDSAFDTYFAQAFGSPNKKKVGIYLQTGLIFNLFMALFFLAIYISSYDILVLISQPPSVARITEEYLIYFSPGVLFFSVFIITSKYLQVQGYSIVPMVAEILALIVNICLQYIFVYIADLGVRLVHVYISTRGSAIAHASGFAVMLILILIYILVTGVYKNTWDGWSLDCLEEWGKISKLGLSAMVLVCIDWWAIEIGLFLIGSLGTVPLGAAGILFQVLEFIFAFAAGIAIQWVYKIGRSLGQGEGDQARRYSNFALFIAAVSSLIISILLLSLMTVIPWIFTNDQEVYDMTVYLFPFAAAFLFLDSYKSQLSAVLRACGRQLQAAILSFFFLTIVTFSIAVPITLFTSIQILGYWIGAIIGAVFCGLGYNILIIRISWDTEVELAKKRVDRAEARKAEMTDVHNDITENSNLLKNISEPKRKNSFLIIKRITALLPFLSLFIISIALKVALPPYSNTPSNSTSL